MSVVNVSLALVLGAVALGTVSAHQQDLSFWDPLNLPKSFDARARWPDCPSIGAIHDQGNCRASYAISVASAASDRICIHSGGSLRPKISAQQILACCFLCGYQCYGGMHYESWDFYRRHGFVSGGSYGSYEGCQPYAIEPCKHTLFPDKNSCANKTFFSELECSESKCTNPEFGKTYRNDKYRGTSYQVPAYLAMKEIYEKGPITASFFMYQDFLNYQSGVYSYSYGKFVTVQAVKIIGWGEHNGIPYWLAANSYNTDWGENGFFRIRRGSNECYIEQSMFAGLPL